MWLYLDVTCLILSQFMQVQDLVEVTQDTLDDVWKQTEHDPPYPESRMRHFMDVIGIIFHDIISILMAVHQSTFVYDESKYIVDINNMLLLLLIQKNVLTVIIGSDLHYIYCRRSFEQICTD